MKRRRMLFLLAFFCLLSACAAQDKRQTGQMLGVYYRIADGGLSAGSAVGKVVYPLPEDADSLHEALHRIAEAPNERYISALPQGIRVSAYNLTDGDISVMLTGGYQGLSAVDRTLARCCLVLTLCGLDEVDSVSIYEEDRLAEAGLTPDVMLAESTMDSNYLAEITLWYPSKERNCLISEQRQLTIAQFRPLAEYAAEELMSGTQTGLQAALPAGTKLRAVKVGDGLCTVDLSEEFYTNRPTSALRERLTVYALVNTMTELPGVDRVQITVGGGSLGLYTYMDLSQPLKRAEEFGYDRLRDSGWFTVNLYLGTADDKLVPVNVGLDDIDYGQIPNMAVEKLLSLEDSWGYRRLIPPGTRLINMTEADRVVTLQLSTEFLNGNREDIQLAAQALAATVTDAGNALGIRIQVDDISYQNGKLIKKDSDWIVDG